MYVSTVPLSLTVTLQVRAPEVGRVHLAALTTAFFAAFVSVTANVAVDEVNAPLYRLATAGLNGELILAPFSVMLETISGTEIVNGAHHAEGEVALGIALGRDRLRRTGLDLTAQRHQARR